MDVQVSRQDPARAAVDVVVVPLPRRDSVPRALRGLDATLGGPIRAWLDSGSFHGRADELAVFPTEGIAANHVLLTGFGEEKSPSAEAIRRAVGNAITKITQRRWQSASIVVPRARGLAAQEIGQLLAEGAILGGYRFDAYQTMEEKPPGVSTLRVHALDARQLKPLRRGVKIGAAIAESVLLARNLVNEPGSVATPEWLAAQARKLSRQTGLRAKVMTERQLEQQKMGAILAVGRGAAHPPRLIVLEHGRAGDGRPCIALVGKGVTFDSGGISIKPAKSMTQMKGDMAGGAAVIGALRAAALLQLPIHLVGIVGAAMNMPSGNAYVPGDIVRTASGKTIEVLNTDAEGRVVLADALHYATRYQPKAIIDVATLTGAKIIGLGRDCCAVMGNNAGLIRQLREAGDRTHERAWELPLWEEHKKSIKSDVADLKNTSGQDAGSSTAGALLSFFVGDVPWAHLDIAGNEMVSSHTPYCPPGATGFGVRLLVDLLRNWD